MQLIEMFSLRYLPIPGETWQLFMLKWFQSNFWQLHELTSFKKEIQKSNRLTTKRAIHLKKWIEQPENGFPLSRSLVVTFKHMLIYMQISCHRFVISEMFAASTIHILQWCMMHEWTVVMTHISHDMLQPHTKSINSVAEIILLKTFRSNDVDVTEYLKWIFKFLSIIEFIYFSLFNFQLFWHKSTPNFRQWGLQIIHPWTTSCYPINLRIVFFLSISPKVICLSIKKRFKDECHFDGSCVGDKTDPTWVKHTVQMGFWFVKVINYTLVQDIVRFICEIVIHRLRTRIRGGE